MRAIELFPYWDDNRTLLLQVLAPLRDEDLEFRPAPDLHTLGDILRHVITTEEHWWRGGICGDPVTAWRPEGWERFTVAEKNAYRTRRFPSLDAIREGLAAAHAPVEAFLTEFDAWGLCERRQAVWGEDNSLRWMLWHLVEHDQHHRAQVAQRARLLGHHVPATFPRTAVMGRTPATDWRAGEEQMHNIVPYWDHVHGVLRRAVADLSEDDLTFTPAPGLPSVHDLILHIFIHEDALSRAGFREDGGHGWERIELSDAQVPLRELARTVGVRFPTVGALLEGLDTVHAATRAWLETLSIETLAATRAAAAGPQTLHHALWYEREHTVHHRAELFLWLRMLGIRPPDI